MSGRVEVRWWCCGWRCLGGALCGLVLDVEVWWYKRAHFERYVSEFVAVGCVIDGLELLPFIDQVFAK